MSIQFITPRDSSPDDAFTVDFHQLLPPASGLESQKKVHSTSKIALEMIKVLFLSLGQATAVTFKNGGTSFKKIVLGYYGDRGNFRLPENIFVVILNVFIWKISLLYFVVATTHQGDFIKKT